MSLSLLRVRGTGTCQLGPSLLSFGRSGPGTGGRHTWMAEVEPDEGDPPLSLLHLPILLITMMGVQHEGWGPAGASGGICSTWF